MRYRNLYVLMALLVPLAVWSGQLTSISASNQAKSDFFILSLHFDREIPYTVTERDGGAALQLSLPRCRVDEDVASEIAGLKNALIDGVQLKSEKEAVVLDFRFSARMKSVVWETKNPFSLVLDVSSAAKTKPVSSPRASVKEKSSKTERSTFVPAGSSRSTSKDNRTSRENQKVESAPQKKGTRAAGSVSQKVEESSSTSQAHFQEGLALRERGQYLKALEHFQQARQDPQLAVQATTEIANTYRLLGRSSDETAEWEKLFALLKEKGYSPIAASEIESNGESTGDLAADGPHPPSQPGAQRKGGGFAIYFLYFISLVLVGMVIWLYRALREVRRTIAVPLADGDSDQSDLDQPELDAEPEEEPEAAEPPPPPSPPADETKPEAEEPAQPEEPSAETEEVPPRLSSETAREVFDLSEQGLSVQEIAEKLGMGQDEVRLILNLQREEKAAVETA